MTDEIKKLKFKENVPLQIEVVPLDSLIKAKKDHLITPHHTNFYHVFLFENCQPTHYVDFEKSRCRCPTDDFKLGEGKRLF